jgi:L-arabinose isomerase
MKKEPIDRYEFWMLAGSQHLYGEETIRQVEAHARTIAAGLDNDDAIPCKVVYKATAKSSEEIEHWVMEANRQASCAGLVVWMHTFSPSKMWIGGLGLLQKPYCHLHTQFNRNIPDKEIDMDFMNLNQSAHGDREHGFMAARMRLRRKIVVGYWEDKEVRQSLGTWMRAAVGAVESKQLKVVRFGDNMRDVAVTEGDKVGVQIQLGWQVNGWGAGDLEQVLEEVPDAAVERKIEEYRLKYDFPEKELSTIRYQARQELALRAFLDREGASAFTDTFENLGGMRQLPGLAVQNLMASGYGFGAEGDWKVSAMTALVKRMTEGMDGGTSFMEDYTYDLTKGKEYSLGAHMLEVCPSIAAGRARIAVHPLGIGGKEPPARLVFEGHPGKAVVASMIDMGGRVRLIVQDIEAIKPIYAMPNLPVARIMWKPLPDLLTGAHLWILAGGAHHTVLSFDATAQMLEDWCEIMGIEFVHIGKDSTVEGMKQQLFLSDLAWKFS